MPVPTCIGDRCDTTDSICRLAVWPFLLCPPACVHIKHLHCQGVTCSDRVCGDPAHLTKSHILVPYSHGSLGTQVDLEYLLNAAGSLPTPPQLRTAADVDSVSTYLEGLAMSQQPASDVPASADTPSCHPQT